MKKVVVTPGFHPAEEAIARLREVARVVVLPDEREAVLLAELADADALLIGIERRITRRIIESAPLLRHIARQGVGADMVDLQAASERGIYVTNVPDVTSDSVAEFTIALLLALAKNIVRCDRAVRGGRWEQRAGLIQDNLELCGKTHGIIGMGRIGSRVAVRCRAFGMEVLYHRRNRVPDFERTAGVRYAPLLQLLRVSDSISLHLPLTAETANLIAVPQFAAMKRGVLLVNHSRGTVVNETALVRALADGTVGGYGTDVYESEPPDPAGELFSFRNVVATPHLGGANRDARARANRIVAEEAIRIFRGELPLNLVNRELLQRGHLPE